MSMTIPTGVGGPAHIPQPAPGTGGQQATVGGHPAAQVPPNAHAQALVGNAPAQAPAAPPPALHTYAEYKNATKLDGFFRGLIDKRSPELKAVDAQVSALMPQLTTVAGMSDRDLLANFAGLKQAHAGLDAAVQAWDPSQHARGAKVQGEVGQLTQHFNAIEQRYNALLGQDPAANAAALVRQNGGGAAIIKEIVSRAPDTQSALQGLFQAGNDGRVMLDDPTLTAQQKTDLTALTSAANFTLQRFTGGMGEDAAGSTSLHSAAKNAGNATALSQGINDHPADLDTPNAIGQTPLLLAITKHADVGMMKDLISAGADVNTPGLLETFKPLDVARAVNRTGIIGDLVAAGATSAIDADDLKPSACQNLSTEQIILKGTLTCDASSAAYFQTGLQNLMAEPRFQPLLDLAAQRMIGDPAQSMDALRMNFIPLRDASLLVGGMGAGAYVPDTNTLSVAGKESQKDMQGTLIHELCHHAVEVLFDNETQPFAAQELADLKAGTSIDGTTLKSYLDAIAADKGHAPGSTDPQAAKVKNTVLDRVDSYNSGANPFTYNNNTYNTAMMQEYVVGIPQAINDFGYAAVQATTPNLLAFYEQKILPLATAEANQLSQRTTP